MPRHPSTPTRLLTQVASPSRGEGSLADMAQTAARLCKADLVTGMVGEFPELQGIMGGYYARAQGYPDAVADAIRDHYKPVGQGDDVPTDPVTVAVSLADKLDTLIGFFGIREVPTGSRDPFALRRAALAIIALATTHQLRIPFAKLLTFAVPCFVYPFVNSLARALADADVAALVRAGNNPHGVTSPKYQEKLVSHPAIAAFTSGFAESASPLMEFLADRLKVQQREAGVRHDLIDAVFALGGEDDLVRLLARVKALQAFVTTQEGKNLLAGYKRAANILKKEAPQSPLPTGRGDSPTGERGRGLDAATSEHPHLLADARRLPLQGEVGLSYTPEPCEAALIAALDTAEPLAAAAIEREDFEAAMSALATLRAPIDAFFEGVMVNDPNPELRSFRLGLLARFRDAVHRVADFSKIEG